MSAWFRSGTYKTAQPRGTKSHLCVLVVKKSGSRAAMSRGMWPIPCAPSMRERMPSSLQTWVSCSKGMRTPGREEMVSKMATRGYFLAAREARMVALKMEIMELSGRG